MNPVSGTGMEKAEIYMNREKFSDLKKSGNQGFDGELMNACKDFEGLLINQMLKEMRETVPEGGIFPESNGRKIWKSVYDEKLSVQISSGSNNIGLSKFLYEQLSDQTVTGLKDN